ncbi:hypothetical protein [Vibrio taketomensis]|uniref:hypothetical protein n=1 Tax=Vibrio taketomensis TaxID=2572923 RepID=UPI0013895E3E|nr:hypothetical protein [Vibrio taketomensis]
MEQLKGVSIFNLTEITKLVVYVFLKGKQRKRAAIERLLVKVKGYFCASESLFAK